MRIFESSERGWISESLKCRRCWVGEGEWKRMFDGAVKFVSVVVVLAEAVICECVIFPQ